MPHRLKRFLLALHCCDRTFDGSFIIFRRFRRLVFGIGFILQRRARFLVGAGSADLTSERLGDVHVDVLCCFQIDQDPCPKQRVHDREGDDEPEIGPAARGTRDEPRREFC